MKGSRKLSHTMCLLLILLFLNIMFHSQTANAEVNERELRIRAALLFYIAKFVTWPYERNLDVQQLPFRICSVGTKALDPFVESTVVGKTVRGRTFTLRSFANADFSKIADCDVLFLGGAFIEQAKRIVPEGNRSPILVVCDVEQVSWQGCMVQIFVEDNRARLAIDPRSARERGLEINSELLDVAVKRPEE